MSNKACDQETKPHSLATMSSTIRLFSRSIAVILPLLPLALSAQQVIDFSDLSLPQESYYNGSDGAGGFSSGGAYFHNVYDADPNYPSWGGWAFSNVTDHTSPDWTNQFASITGDDLGANGIYGIAYVDTYKPAIPRITLPSGQAPLSLQVTNTAYAYFTVRDGDGSFSKKFGGNDGNDQDFFLLTITGIDASEGTTGSVDFYLADYRFADNSLDYVVDAWSDIDLSSLSAETRHLEFTLTSTDTGFFGMNTPAYFAMNELTVIPEPSTYALGAGLFFGFLVLGHRFHTRSRKS